MPKTKPKKRQTGNPKPKKSLKPLLFLSTIFIVLTVFGAILNNYGNNLSASGQQEKKQFITNYRGTLTSYYNINTSELFTISIGTVSTSFSANALASGIDLTRFINIVLNNQTVSFPFSLSFENNTIHVYASIKDKNNQTIGTINDNDWWSANPQSTATVYDRNYNSYAFELIDDNRIPILQVLMDKPNEIDIGVSFIPQDIPMYFGINGTIFDMKGFTYQEIQIMRQSTLFKYPSSQYLGELNRNVLVNLTYPSGNVLSGSEEKIKDGNIFAIIGDVFSIIFAVSIGAIAVEELMRKRNEKK